MTLHTRFFKIIRVRPQLLPIFMLLIAIPAQAAFTPPPRLLSSAEQYPPAKSITAMTAAAQNDFFAAISQLCGQAFTGKLAVDTSGSDRFADAQLLMHVRECSDTQIKIPFYVGEDASRTWILTKTGGGLLLKHDHRHKDGSHDDLTLYGGHTQQLGSAHTQVFPVDVFTQELFIELGYPQSLTNIWEMFIYPDTFTYRLTRAGFEFKVEFDLTQPVVNTRTPWGHR
jgi:hypothetical protein